LPLHIIRIDYGSGSVRNRRSTLRSARTAAQIVEQVRVGGREDVGVGHAGPGDRDRVEECVVELLVDLPLRFGGLDVAQT
jgi:hypothetical protein